MVIKYLSKMNCLIIWLFKLMVNNIRKNSIVYMGEMGSLVIVLG